MPQMRTRMGHAFLMAMVDSLKQMMIAKRPETEKKYPRKVHHTLFMYVKERKRQNEPINRIIAGIRMNKFGVIFMVKQKSNAMPASIKKIPEPRIIS